MFAPRDGVNKHGCIIRDHLFRMVKAQQEYDKTQLKAGWYRVQHIRDDLWTEIYIFEGGKTWAHDPDENPQDLDLEDYIIKPSGWDSE